MIVVDMQSRAVILTAAFATAADGARAILFGQHPVVFFDGDAILPLQTLIEISIRVPLSPFGFLRAKTFAIPRHVIALIYTPLVAIPLTFCSGISPAPFDMFPVAASYSRRAATTPAAKLLRLTSRHKHILTPLAR